MKVTAPYSNLMIEAEPVDGVVDESSGQGSFDICVFDGPVTVPPVVPAGEVMFVELPAG